jgi:hypothetical protein
LISILRSPWRNLISFLGWLVVCLQEDALADHPGGAGAPQDVVPTADGHLGNWCSHLNVLVSFCHLHKKCIFQHKLSTSGTNVARTYIQSSCGSGWFRSCNSQWPHVTWGSPVLKLNCMWFDQSVIMQCRPQGSTIVSIRAYARLKKLMSIGNIIRSISFPIFCALHC